MASSNFQQWNPTQANQENDSAYSSDSQRSGGAPTGGTTRFPSATFNKFAFQVSTMCAALANFIVSEGLSADDSNLTTLQTNLTQAILNACASVLDPALASLAPIGAFSATNPGYVKIPGTPLIMQWGSVSAIVGTPSGSAGFGTTVPFPITFPNAVFSLQFGMTQEGWQDGHVLRAINLTTSSFDYNWDSWVINGAGNSCEVSWFAIGY